jgi:PAS domain-containing protein
MRGMQAVVECSPHPIVLCDTAGCVKSANARWRECVGAEDSKPWISIVHPSEQEITRDMWDQHVSLHVAFAVTHRLRDHKGEFR